jgi:hypothetical protein
MFDNAVPYDNPFQTMYQATIGGASAKKPQKQQESASKQRAQD